MIRKLATAPALALLLAAIMAPTAGAVPAVHGLPIGISPQTPASDGDYGLMERAGIRSIRLPLHWGMVEPYSPYLVEPRWQGFDREVELAAKYGMRVFPFVWGTPTWVARDAHAEPVQSAAARRAWASFLRRAVRRYGPRGSFWRERPELPYLPVRAWEIWNEQNLVTFSKRPSPRRFARLLRVSGRAIHGANRGSKVIVGGLFGRPLQIPPNVDSAAFVAGIYRAGRVKQHFDGVALHPYVADAGAIRGQVRRLRRAMQRFGDARTPLYMTELGWGSDRNESRWERGLHGQARELDRAFAMLARNRRNWRIGGVWWFSWADADTGCQFCDSAGLLTHEREAKPSWYRFNAWTGGDANIVPRARFAR